MGQFDRQVATAIRLIEKFGQSVTWRQMTDGAPADSEEPWKPGAATSVDRDVTMVFLPEDRHDMEFLYSLDKTTVPTGKLTALMGQVSFTPTLKDTVIRNGVSLGIRTIDPLAPNGQIVLYTVRFDL